MLGSPGSPSGVAPGALEAHETSRTAGSCRLSAASKDITDSIEGFTFQDSINAGYAFAWNEFCDWYLEAVRRGCATVTSWLDVAYFCLDSICRLLHPFMPFVTEELWSRLPESAT